jgi:solute:Na+ symporter, SSS family
MMITYIVLIVYLLVLIYIGLRSYARVENIRGFFVAHKKGNFWQITGSLVATILGGSAVIGAIDAGSSMGGASSWFMLSAAMGLLALLPLTGKITSLGRFTLPDLLETLHGPRAKQIAAYVIPVAWLGIVAAQLIAAARILQSFAGIDYSTGVVLSGVVFTLYTIAGGQISILKTDLLQAVLILGGLILLTFYSSRYLQQTHNQNPLPGFPFNQQFQPVDLLILLITYATTFTVGPDIYSRLFCANGEKVARRALATTAFILIPVAFMIGYLSITGTQLNGSSGQGASLVEISHRVLPVWAVPLVVIALLSAVLSSADTTILSASIIITDIVSKNHFGERTLKQTRFIILVIGIFSIIIATQMTSIIEMLLMALAVYSGAFILPVLLGLMGLRSKPSSVSLAIVSGGSIALIGNILQYTQLGKWSNTLIFIAFIINALFLLTGRKKGTEK